VAGKAEPPFLGGTCSTTTKPEALAPGSLSELRESARGGQLTHKNNPAPDVRLERDFAPRVGLEPTTLRLTAACSTIELSRNSIGKEQRDSRMLRADTEGGGPKSRRCLTGLYHFIPMLFIGMSYRGIYA
jgi:hypothetical protein